MSLLKEAVAGSPIVDRARQRTLAMVNLTPLLVVAGEPQDATKSRTNAVRDALIDAYAALRVSTLLASAIHAPSTRAEPRLAAVIEAKVARDGSYALARRRVTGIIHDLVASAPDEDDHGKRLTALAAIRIKASELNPHLRLGEEADKLVEQLGAN